MTSHSQSRANLIGSLWMIAAMAGFAIEDSFIKIAAQSLPIGEILIIFGAGGALFFAALLWISGEPLFTADVMSTAMRIRFVFEITGRLFYALALALIPLATATVILQATPLVVVGAATVLFGERASWQRWAAILCGALGVVIIIGPATEDFTILSLLAVVGMLGFAGRDLASRAAPATISTALLGLYGFVAVLIAGAAFSLWDPAPMHAAPTPTICLALAGAILAGVAAYSFLMKAMRTGQISAVTPFRYTRLLFGAAAGVLLFGEQVSAAMVFGAALIVISGLFIVSQRN